MNVKITNPGVESVGFAVPEVGQIAIDAGGHIEKDLSPEGLAAVKRTAAFSSYRYLKYELLTSESTTKKRTTRRRVDKSPADEGGK